MPSCLVVGGSGHVGQAVCRELAAGGARVAFTYHTNKQAAEALLAELPEAHAEPLDVTDSDAIERTVTGVAGRAGFGSLDAVIYCAGVAAGDDAVGDWSTEAITPAAWDRVFAVNVRGAFFACERAARLMKSTGGGNLVIVSSIDGSKPVPSKVDYASSKAALVGMVRSLGKALGPSDVRVNLIAAGILDGGLAAQVPSDISETYLRHCALGRFGTAREIAQAAVWLALENTYMTGRALLQDGGL